ncbi:MAG: DUF2911 domain-containing protein [Flavobacteriales bacterium]|nr:DUF2911 domain-containing protein [Flavobacteriales bacterium]
MKILSTLIIAACLVLSTASQAQIDTPQPSPLCKISQKVALTDVEIEYSRPGMKARTIFGGLVPYGEMWRLGANASTKIKTSTDIELGGLKVPKGEYALYAIPEEGQWTIVVHKNLKHWGVGEYDEAEDLGRFKVKSKKTSNTVETLTIDFGGFTSSGANLMIMWENTVVNIPIKTNAIQAVEKQIQQVLVDGPSAGTYYNAARFYLDNDKDMKQALIWIDTAIDKRPEAFWYMHQKAKIQAKMGMNKEAIATATKSMEMAQTNEEGDYGYVKNNEMLIADIKAGKYDMKK